MKEWCGVEGGKRKEGRRVKERTNKKRENFFI
jgi:hypothetical protein